MYFFKMKYVNLRLYLFCIPARLIKRNHAHIAYFALQKLPIFNFLWPFILSNEVSSAEKQTLSSHYKNRPFLI